MFLDLVEKNQPFMSATNPSHNKTGFSFVCFDSRLPEVLRCFRAVGIFPVAEFLKKHCVVEKVGERVKQTSLPLFCEILMEMCLFDTPFAAGAVGFWEGLGVFWKGCNPPR